VTSRGAATRYARALFDVSLAEGKDLAATSGELNDFARLMADQGTLGRALTNPAIPASRKHAVVEQLLARAGTVQPPVAKILLMLAERDRLALVPDVARAFESRLMDHQRVIRAEVVTAIDLPSDRLAALQQSLAKATGRDVRLASRVDPDLIGGAVARIGSTVYDGSISRQLERIKESLTSDAS
jgi:F-type H+-transporting ATPase subunit delta